MMTSVHIYWLILPLVIAISLVYCASRHEAWRRIWWHLERLSLWIMGILMLATAVLVVINNRCEVHVRVVGAPWREIVRDSTIGASVS